MTTVIAFIALLLLAVVLVRYARHDHFAGAALRTPRCEELGRLVGAPGSCGPARV